MIDYGGGRNVALFDYKEITMARRSRYLAYAEGIKKLSEKKVEKSTPESILAKLKEFKGKNAVISVSVGDENE